MNRLKKQPSAGFKSGVLANYVNSTGKKICAGVFSDQPEGITLLKKGFQHSCFPVKFAKLPKTLCLQKSFSGCMRFNSCFQRSSQ